MSADNGTELTEVNDESLHAAVRQNDCATVQRLVSDGTDINLRDTAGCTPLHVACSGRCVDAALCLLNLQCNSELLDNVRETALHKACREDLLPVVQALCAYGCSVNLVNKAGQAALHIAARVGDTEVVRCLVLAGADIDLLSKDGLRAEDISQGQGHVEVADLLARMSTPSSPHRIDPYVKQLMTGGVYGVTGSPGNDRRDAPCYEVDTGNQTVEQPLCRLKLKLFGNCDVGKTTLVDSLRCGYIRALFRQLSVSRQGHDQGTGGQGQTSVKDVEAGTKNEHVGCTRCIDVQQVNISGAGEVSVWEFSGNSCYYICYDHFIGDPNCIHCVVFRASDPAAVQRQQIHFWLNFLRARLAATEPIGFAGTQLWATRILLVATHADQAAVTSLRRNGRGELELANNASLITSLQTSFGAHFIIAPRVYVADARQASGADMRALRTVIGSTKQFICRNLPSSMGLLDATVAMLPAWTRMLNGFPAVRWPTFVEYIRSRVNILATEYHLQELICQLQLIGEVVYIEAVAGDLIVIDPRWLCGDVLGKLLAEDRGHLLPYDGRLSSAHIARLFPDIDVADAVVLLVALEFCAVIGADTGAEPRYQVSCRNSLPVPVDDVELESRPCVGGVALVAESSACLIYVFPRVQHAVWNSAAVAHSERPLEWAGGIRFRRSSDCGEDDIIEIRLDSEEADEDLIPIVCRGHEPQKLFKLLQNIVAVVLRTVDTCCPGVYVELQPLSPRDIRRGNPKFPRTYVPKEIVSAQLEGREDVRVDESEGAESLKDVLGFGDEDLYSTLRPGIELHVSQLCMFTRCRLAALLDPPHPLGRDWLLLALGLGLTDSVPRVDAQDIASLSRTDCVLALWSRSPDATIRRLLDVVRRTLQRSDIEEMLLQLCPLYRSSNVDLDRSGRLISGTGYTSADVCNDCIGK